MYKEKILRNFFELQNVVMLDVALVVAGILPLFCN